MEYVGYGAVGLLSFCGVLWIAGVLLLAYQKANQK